MDAILAEDWYASGERKGMFRCSSAFSSIVGFRLAGNYTKARERVSNTRIDAVGRQFGLDECIQTNAQNLQSVSGNIMVTGVEAIIGHRIWTED